MENLGWITKIKQELGNFELVAEITEERHSSLMDHANKLNLKIIKQEKDIILENLTTPALKILNEQISAELNKRGINSRKVRQYVEGEKIGKLTIICELKEEKNEKGYGIKQFNCLCSCGEYVKRTANYLTELKEKSCCVRCGKIKRSMRKKK